MFPQIFLVLMSVWSTAWSHGRLIDPPGRSTMWRSQYGNFKTEPNYDDDALWCGGMQVLWSNEGKCGICGDRWDGPRHNEDGGKYGQKIIVRTYKRGEIIEVKVDVTKHHKGYFEFRLCPMIHEEQIADQECLDRYLLPVVDGSGTKYTLPTEGLLERIYTIRLKLPEDLTCERCVFQWHYRTGNHWGVCEDRTQRMGCGMQEYFRGCADVAIVSDNDITNESSCKKPPYIVEAKKILKPRYPGSDKQINPKYPPSVINNLEDHIPAKSVPNYDSYLPPEKAHNPEHPVNYQSAEPGRCGK